MARAWRIRYAGAKYHVTVRGNGRQTVFHDDDYYLRFIEQLSEALEKDQVVLYAFALMPNHFHLFIETPFGNVQRFMQRLNTSYSMYHRFKYRSPGHCFQGRYGAKVVRGDEYILALTRYIHLNPVKVGGFRGKTFEERRAELERFPWSSYRAYVGKPVGYDLKVDSKWLDLMGNLTLKKNRTAYQKYVEGFITKTDEVMKTSLAANRYAVGDEKFVEQVEADLKNVKVGKGIYGDIRWPVGEKVPLAAVGLAVATEFGCTEAELQSRRASFRTARKIAMELSCLYSGLSQRKVGEYYGYEGNGSVLKQRQKLKELRDKDPAVEKLFGRVEKRLKGG